VANAPGPEAVIGGCPEAPSNPAAVIGGLLEAPSNPAAVIGGLLEAPVPLAISPAVPNPAADGMWRAHLLSDSVPAAA